MLRSRRYFKDLRGSDQNTPEYWDEMLRRAGLTMDAGTHKAISYVGNSNNVNDIYEKVVRGEEAPKEVLRFPSQSDTTI